LNINNSNVYIEVDKRTSVFTSGNTKIRGNHIPAGPENKYVTVIYTDSSPHFYCNTLIDYYATKVFAGEDVSAVHANDFPFQLRDEVTELFFDDITGLISNSTYIASPFFDDDQIMVRDAMESKFENPFRPDLTESSVRYDNGDDLAVHDVVRENIDGIWNSNLLVYPMDTDDLGTLFEVGLALSLNKRVIRYDHKSDTYTVIISDTEIKYKEADKYLFDCRNKDQAIALGYMSNRVDTEKIHYMLNGSPDNIMLSVNFKHVEPVAFGDKIAFKVIERDLKDRDK
jgi:nucleoside 2-deoxyribosyltransferase